MEPAFTRDEVFVVDDSRAVRDLVCQHLSRLGCEPVPLSSGAACLAELERRVPALVLLDLRMEGMQGDEACRRMKAHPNAGSVPVVMLTSASAPHEVMLVLDAGTGQNALAQAKHFQQAVGVTGLALTKLDGTAKGGIIVQVQRELGVPVKLVGLGEGPDDLAPFDPEVFVDAILG